MSCHLLLSLSVLSSSWGKIADQSEHYFEMAKSDAKESFEIYKSFIKQTDRVVDYLSMARKLHNVVNIPVPNLKHAPTGLVKALEEYLNDPDFESNRVEYRKSLGVVEGRSGARDPSPSSRSSLFRSRSRQMLRIRRTRRICTKIYHPSAIISGDFDTSSSCTSARLIPEDPGFLRLHTANSATDHVRWLA